jgi:hypothetical protein
LTHRLSIALGLIVALIGAPSIAAASAATTYHVVYGPKDLGVWTTMSSATQKNGTYTLTSFDSSQGPGYPTLSFTRTMSASDQALFASLPKPNVKLVVTAMKNGKAVSVTTCSVANLFSDGTQGDPGTGTTNVTFACISVSTGKPA